MARNTVASPPQERWPLLLHRADQLTVVALVGILLLLLVGHWILGIAVRGSSIEIDHAPPLRLEYRIHLNEADWPELTLLPGIGKTLAQRIVADRTRNGCFASLEQLQRVKGIGPKTIRRIRAHVVLP